MKIVEKFGKMVSLEKVEEIYEKGNKIALVFFEDTSIGDETLVHYNEGDMKIGSLKYEFGVDDHKMLYLKANTPVVIEKVIDDKLGALAVVKPYEDAGELEFCLLEDLEDGTTRMADEVYEVEL